MGLFGKLLPTSPGRIGIGGAAAGGRSSNTQEGGDYWIPSAIEFASHSQDDEEELNQPQQQQQQQHQDGGGFYDSFLSNSTGSGIAEYSGAAVVPAATSTGGGGGGIGSGRGGSSSGAGSGGFGTMTGRGINSREISPPHPSLMTNTTDAMPTRRAHDMVGTGINSRLSAANATQQQPAQQQYYQQQQQQYQQQNHYEQQQQYQQQQQYYYQQQEQQQQHQQQHTPSTTNPFLNDDDDGNSSPGLNESMKLMEEKLKSIDNSKFMHFDHNYTTTDDDDDDDIDGDGFTSESKSSGGGGVDNAMTKKKKKSKSGATGLIKMFGKKKEKMRLRRQQQLQEQQQKQSQPRNHRPIVDSDYSSSEENDVNSHISGEEDYHNSENVRRSSKTAQNPSYGGGGIGVPNGNGSQLTTAQLEDELYRYKLETLNLTDACRDLLEQLDEVEGRLGTVQAQATFRIHALEAELQDNTLGLKSLVKMTSTEMDGRLEALRAVSKTMSVQAARLKERDGELVLLEQRLRKAQREVRRLKRQNKKVMDEKTYLKTRLDELNQSKYQLEEDMQALVTENEVKAVAMSAEEQSKMEDILKELEEKLDQLENVKSELECKDRELIELVAHVEEKDGEVMKMRQELDTKGECSFSRIYLVY